MRHFTLILTFLIFFFSGIRANKIDSLKSDKEVEGFIESLFQKIYNVDRYTFSLKKPDSVTNYIPCDSTIYFDSNLWKKIDFNKDGFTDLFAILYQRDTINSSFPSYTVYVVIDLGKDKFQLIKIPQYFMINCYSVKLMLVENEPCLIYRYYKSEYTIDTLPAFDTVNIPFDSLGGTMTMPKTQINYFQVGKTDTLIYKFGGFVELKTQNRMSPEIESIYFRTTPCYGDCPVFDINIFKDGLATYVRNQDSEGYSGNFKCTINLPKLNEIFDLIKYLSVSDLEDSYFINATHMQTMKLSINFSNGKTKTIEDYGHRGTMGLIRLYDLLSELRHNQKWE